jgi:protocatechuate 3,4-dioxygenase beta subunit
MQKRSWFAAGGLAAIVILGGGLFLLMEERSGERPGEPGAPPREAEAPAPIAERAPPEPAPPIARPAKPPAPAPEAPAGGFAITARLLRSDGSPAADVPVHVDRRREGGPGLPNEVIPSGADGRWLLRGVPAGIPLELVIDDPGSALLVLDFWLREKEKEGEVDLGDLTLAPPHSLRLQVVGPDERPVRKAKVIAGTWLGRELEQKGFRAAERQVPERGEGEYVLERVQPGELQVQVRADGFAFKPNSPASVEVPREESLLVRVENGARIAGIVRDAAGKPLPGAELTLHGSPESQDYQGIRADATGRFELDYLVPGEYEVWVEAGGYASQRRRGIAAGGGDVEFILEPEAVFSGRVVDEEGNPIVRATVFISYEEVTENGISGHNAQTDAEGRFIFDRVGGGRFQVSAQHDAFLPFEEAQELELISGQRVEGRVIRLERGLQASGRVTDSGDQKPIAGARVEFRFLDPERKKGEWLSSDSRDATTGADGAFVVKALREGEHEISCSAKGYFGKKGERVALSGRSLERLDLTLERGASISGRVLDPDGKPVAEAQVSARAASRRDEHHSTSDREGGFRIVALPEAPDYRVKAWHDEFAPATVPGISVKGREDVSGIEIRLSKGGSIRGRVRDHGGIAIAKSTVYAIGASREDGEVTSDAGAESDEEGGYEISRLQPGTYTVTAESPGLARVEKSGVRVEEGKAASGVDFTLGAGKSLSGRVVDAGGRPIEGAAVELVGQGGIRAYTIDSATTGSDGRFTVKWGEEMQPSLSASKSGYEKAYLKDSSAAGEVTLTLERSGIIAGQVKAPGGGSLKRLEVWAVIPGEFLGFRFSQGDEDGERTRVEPSGRFEVSVAPGTHTIQAQAAGYAPALAGPITVGPGERREGVLIDLVPEARIGGTVLRKGAKTPFEEASVAIRPASGGYGALPYAGATASGRFSLEGVPAGAFDLVVEYGQNKKKTFTGFDIASGETKEIHLEVEASGGIRGIVRRGGRPVEGAEVSIEMRAGKDEVRDFTRAGAEGRFEISGLPAGEYRVRVSEGFSDLPPRRVSVAEGRSAEVKFDFDAGYPLSGRVTLGGAAAVGFDVFVSLVSGSWSSSATTDGHGAYTILLPQSGAYQVVVEGAESCDARFELKLPEGVRERDFLLELPASGISGVVVDARSGEPLPQARLAAVATSPPGGPLPLGNRGFRAMASADDSGRFAMTCLPPGTYDLWAWSEGHAASRVQGIRVEAGKSVEDLRIALEAEAVVPGRVVDGRGLPVEGARGYLRDAEGNVIPGVADWLRSDARGSMEIHGVGKGPFRLIVLHPSFARSEVPLPAGGAGEPVVVRLDSGGSVLIEAVDDSGRPLDGIPLEILDARGISLADERSLMDIDDDLPLQSGPDGSLSIDHLAPGAYRALAKSRDSRSGEAPFTVESGRVTSARIVLSR